MDRNDTTKRGTRPPWRLWCRTIDASPDHLAVLNEQGTILAVNQAWRRFAENEGLRMPDHAVGQNYIRVCEEARGADSDEARSVANGLRSALAASPGQFRHDYDCHSPGVERWFELSATRFSDRGKAYLVVAHHCVSRLKRLERDLRESEERYRALLEMSPHGVAVHQKGRIVYANPAARALLHLDDSDAALGRNVLDFVDEADQVTVLARVQSVLNGNPVPPAEINLRRADGSVIMTETNAVLVRWNGQAAVQVTIQDISTRKRRQQQLLQQKDELEVLVRHRTAALEQSLTQLEQFSYALIHDLRAPLRAVGGYTALIRKACAAGALASAAEYIARIERATLRMDNLITDALNYSRTIREEFPVHEVDLNSLIRGLVDTYPELQEHASRIHLPDDLPCVLGNESALTQCLSNLLRNAVKFVAPGNQPEVSVGWSPEDGMALVWVQDKGIGMASEAQAKIFQMFQRLHTSDEYPGTGIGLAIARKAVEQIGGQIGVDSEPGKGSRFWIKLKLSKHHETEHPVGRR